MPSTVDRLIELRNEHAKLSELLTNYAEQNIVVLDSSVLISITEPAVKNLIEAKLENMHNSMMEAIQDRYDILDAMFTEATIDFTDPDEEEEEEDPIP